MSDVKVGDVRRAAPLRSRALGGQRRYVEAPMEVMEIKGLFARVRNVLSGRRRERFISTLERCPLWPSEHEQWKDARGYEVKT